MAIPFQTPGDKRMRALNAVSEVVDTSRGRLEFARHGDAPYVLIMHGTPQGHHASFIGEPFEAAGFGTITPSRPGYLRSPLSSGRMPADQADACAALLDELEIDQVAVYGISGGGPSSIEFAARHPDRTKALILEVAISQTYAPQVSPLTVALAMNSFTFWLQGQLLRYAPKLAVGQMVRMESTLNAQDRARITDEVVASPDKLELLQRLVEGPTFGSLRSGFDNDMAQFAAITELPLRQIQCPALVVHGTHDGDVPFAHAEHAAREIPNATLFTVENGWHLLALSDGDNAYLDTEIDFLKQHLSPTQ